MKIVGSALELTWMVNAYYEENWGFLVEYI